VIAPFAVAVWLLAPAGAIAVKLPPLGELVQAARSRDDVEIERVAARLGPVKLERVAERGKREERLAALRALPLVENAWAMLPQLAKLCADEDVDVGEAAARAARRIAEGLDPARMEAEEVPRDVPRRAQKALLEQAARAELRPDVRVSAIAAAAALRQVVPIDEPALGRLLADEEAQVRRAAVEAMAGGAAQDASLAAALAKDASADVAAAAAAAICRDVPATPPAPKSPPSGAETRAGKLPQPARERLRTLALDDTLPLADRLDLVACLRVFAQPEDQKVLDQLARRPPDALKRRARSLGGR
jgi:hypothetical protein